MVAVLLTRRRKPGGPPRWLVLIAVGVLEVRKKRSALRMWSIAEGERGRVEDRRVGDGVVAMISFLLRYLGQLPGFCKQCHFKDRLCALPYPSWTRY